MKLKKMLVLFAIALVISILIGVFTGGAAEARSRRKVHRRSAIAGYVGGIGLRSGPLSIVRSGGCDWLEPYLSGENLPVATFKAISARESGCSRTGVRVANRTDLSTSRFGLNFRGRMPRYWSRLCGVSNWQAPGASVVTDVHCTAQAYRALGLRPWRAR